MRDIPDMHRDCEPIKSITSVFEGGESHAVGRCGVTKIETYQEPGWGSRITWLAVYVHDKLWARVPPATFMVFYGRPKKVAP